MVVKNQNAVSGSYVYLPEHLNQEAAEKVKGACDVEAGYHACGVHRSSFRNNMEARFHADDTPGPHEMYWMCVVEDTSTGEIHGPEAAYQD
jgi:hypothetical protein